MNASAVWDPRFDAECIYLKREVFLDKPVESAFLRCAGEGAFRLSVNGRTVGRGMGRTLGTALMWEGFDLEAALQPGENAIQVLASSGADGTACFWAMGHIVYKGGGGPDLASGPDWRTTPVVGARCRTGHEEIWMAAAQAPVAADWRAAQILPGSQPRDWEPAPVLEQEAWPVAVRVFGEVDVDTALGFVDRPDPFSQSKCVHREGVLRPGRVQAKIQTRAADRAVYLEVDFGRMVTGLPRLRLRGRAGSTVEMGFARAPGRVDGRARFLCGDGPQDWTGLTLHTCRYLVVRISQCPEEIEVDGIGMVERRVQVPAVGRFTAGPLWEKAWDIGRASLATERQALYLARTAGGRVDWLQGYAWALNDFYLSGDTTAAGAMLASVDAARLPEESLQGLAYCLLLEAYYQYTGDKAAVEQGLNTALDFLTGLAPVTTQDSLVLNAFYGGALAAIARLCRELKRAPQGQALKQQRHALRARLAQGWSAEKGLFTTAADQASTDQWGNGLILYFALASDHQRAVVANALAAATVPVANRLEAFFVAGGLWRSGDADGAMAFMERHWGQEIQRETPSWIASTEPGIMPWAGPEYFLGSRVLGIRPRTAGYRSLTVWPEAGDLVRASGQVQTCNGLVGVDWYRGDAGFFSLVLELERPLETYLWLPRQGRRFPTVRLNGETVWRNEKVHLNPYIRAVACERERLGLVVETAGTYRIEVD